MLVQKDISLVFTVHLMPVVSIIPDLYSFMFFWRRWTAAILDLEVKLTSKLWNKYPIIFVVFMMVQKDISLVFISHLMPDLLCFWLIYAGFYTDLRIFKMEDGGHLVFRGQANPKTLTLVSHSICYINGDAKRHITFVYRCHLIPDLYGCMCYQDCGWQPSWI